MGQIPLTDHLTGRAADIQFNDTKATIQMPGETAVVLGVGQ
jgi:hypothetical protein